MTVRDINSNYAIEPAYDTASGGSAVAVDTSGVFSTPVDLSQSTTANIYLALLHNGTTDGAARISIEYSVDEAFTVPVADPGTLGNSVTDLTGTELTQPAVVDGATPGRNLELMVNIVNPSSEIGEDATAYRYARAKVLNNASDGAAGQYTFTAMNIAGPQRYVAAE